VDALERSALSAYSAALSAYSAADSALSAYSAVDSADSARSAYSAALSAVDSAYSADSTDSAYSAARSALSAADSAYSAALSAVDSADSAYSAARSAALSAVSRDTIRAPEALMREPVWPDASPPPSIAEYHAQFLDYLDSDPDWTFWRRWYAQMWEGTFRDWDLAIEVATLPDDLWEGEDALAKVAEAIRAIEARRALGPIITDLRDSETRVASESFVPLRGHNNPPELIDDPQLVTQVEIVWAALDTLEEEAKADAPDQSRALQALAVLRGWFLAACRYVGRKVDLAINTTIQWGIPVVGGGYFVTHPDKLQKIIELAEIWLRP
jgi:hypothetical protein